MPKTISLPKNVKLSDVIDTSAVLPGENADAFVNRIYQAALWHLFAASAQLELAVYATNELLLDTHYPINKENVTWFMNYYDSFKKRLDGSVNLTEDTIADFRYKFQQGSKHLLQEYIKTVESRAHDIGMPYSILTSHLLGVQMLSDVFSKTWRISLEPLGLLRRAIPQDIDRAIFFLGLMDKKISAIIDHLAPDFKGASVQAGEEVENAVLKLVADVFEGTLVNEAINYSYNENNVCKVKDN